MSTVKISVIIASYNYQNFIKQCIDSVLNQSYKNFELIVVDDCSSDNTRDIITSYGDRLIAVFHKQNLGHGGAFNSGFSVASGELIAFLDADDFYNPGALENLAKNYQKEIAMYQYYLDLVDEKGLKFDIYPKKWEGFDSGDVKAILCDRGKIKTTVTSGLAYSKAVLQQVLPMENELYRQGGDGYLSATVPLYGNVKTINLCLASYRQHSNNHSDFAKNLVNRARWLIEHNKNRFNALEFHTKKLGLTVNEQLGFNSYKYLEQLMVLRLLGSKEDKIGLMSQLEISRSILVVIKNEYEKSYKRFLQIWWWLIGHTTLNIASTLLKWKIDANSRPQFMHLLSKHLKNKMPQA